MRNIIAFILLVISSDLCRGLPFNHGLHKKRPKTVGEHLVTVKIIDNDEISTKTNSQDYLPKELKLKITSSSGDLSLALKRNKHLDLDKVQIITAETDGTERKSRGNMAKVVSFYQDQAKGAVITARNTGNRLSFEGTLVMENKRYELRPVAKSRMATKSYENVFDREVNLLHLHTLKEVELNIDYDKRGSEPQSWMQARMTAKNGGASILDSFGVNKPEVFSDLRKNLKAARVLNTLEHERVARTVSRGQTDFHLELMFVLDFTTYTYWLTKNLGDDSAATDEMLVYFAGIFNGIHMVYSSIETNYENIKITPWLQKIYICKTPSSSWFTEQSVTAKSPSSSAPRDYALDTDTLFPKVSKWRYSKGFSWNDPDHVMVWTRYDVGGNHAIGVAPVGSICLGSATNGGQSVNEDVGFHSWAVAAHELGHNLGANHDGDRNDCSPSSKYIMAPSTGVLTSATVENQHTFSPCSVQAFLNTLQGTADGYPRVCTFDKVCEHGVSVEDTLPGQIYSLTQQCQLAFGDSHSFTTDASCQSSDVCLELRCRKGDRCRWGSARAAEGSPCATNKWCRKGQCVTKTTPTRVDATDEACSVSNHDIPENCEDTDNYKFTVTYDGVRKVLSCEEIIVQHPNFCFSFPVVASNCGHSCFGAGLAYDSSLCENRNEAGGFCSDDPGVTFSSTGGSSGITCSQAASYGWCNSSVVKKRCCGSCSE